MSRIIEFLKGKGTDNQGRKLNTILNWSDAKLEHSHDIIQWLFPLSEPSQFNPDAPVLTEEDIQIMRADNEIRNAIVRSFARFVRFYQNEQWLTPNNHNYLRLTRILRCLGLAGLVKEKNSLKSSLNTIYLHHEKVIGTVTKKFWDEA